MRLELICLRHTAQSIEDERRPFQHSVEGAAFFVCEAEFFEGINESGSQRKK